MSWAQQDQFAKRINRISSGKTTHWTVPGGGLASRKQEGRIASGTRLGTRKPSGVLKDMAMMPLALVVGALAVVLGRWLRFAFLGAEGPLEVDLAEFLDPVLADLAVPLVLALGVGLILGLNTLKRAAALTAGFVAVLYYEHELVRVAPDLYAAFYPPAWISDMLSRPSILTG